MTFLHNNADDVSVPFTMSQICQIAQLRNWATLSERSTYVSNYTWAFHAITGQSAWNEKEPVINLK